MDTLIQRSKAVLIVPRFGESPSAVAKQAENASSSSGTGQGAVALTKYGSPGVLLVQGRRANNWSSPAFFSVAGVSNSTANQDTSGRGTPVIAVFMTQSAADKMETSGTFSLSDLSVAQYSAQPTTPLENADIVVWSPRHLTTSVGVKSSRIHFDSTASNNFYTNEASLGDILGNNVTTGRAVKLQDALASRVASK
jgi:lipid-binding SYLF domain-containing protein